jgi:hypothetical protein
VAALRQRAGCRPDAAGDRPILVPRRRGDVGRLAELVVGREDPRAVRIEILERVGADAAVVLAHVDEPAVLARGDVEHDRLGPVVVLVAVRLEVHVRVRGGAELVGEQRVHAVDELDVLVVHRAELGAKAGGLVGLHRRVPGLLVGCAAVHAGQVPVLVAGRVGARVVVEPVGHVVAAGGGTREELLLELVRVAAVGVAAALQQVDRVCDALHAIRHPRPRGAQRVDARLHGLRCGDRVALDEHVDAVDDGPHAHVGDVDRVVHGASVELGIAADADEPEGRALLALGERSESILHPRVE